MATKRVKVSSPPSDTPAERARLVLKELVQAPDETEKQFYVRLAKKYSSLTDDQWNKLPDYVIGWLNAQVEMIAAEKNRRLKSSAATSEKVETECPLVDAVVLALEDVDAGRGGNYVANEHGYTVLDGNWNTADVEVALAKRFTLKPAEV